MLRIEPMASCIRTIIAMTISIYCLSTYASESDAQRPAPIDSWLTSLSNKLAKCISPIGVLGSPTEQASLPPQSEWIGSVELRPNTQWLVQDGYSHTLVVHGPSNKGFILQSGGIAGEQKVIGPFDLSAICEPGFLESK